MGPIRAKGQTCLVQVMGFGRWEDSGARRMFHMAPKMVSALPPVSVKPKNVRAWGNRDLVSSSRSTRQSFNIRDTSSRSPEETHSLWPIQAVCTQGEEEFPQVSSV